MWYKYKTELNSDIRKNEITKLAGQWVDLEIIILSRETDSERKRHMFSLLCGASFKFVLMYISVGVDVGMGHETRKGFTVSFKEAEKSDTCDIKSWENEATENRRVQGEWQRARGQYGRKEQHTLYIKVPYEAYNLLCHLKNK